MTTNQLTGWSKVDALFISVLFTVIVFTLGPSLDIGGFWNTDESRHAMDGVYVLDVLRNRPFFDLYEYTVQYFARYPALGLTWYPPFFAFVESLVFAVAGISEYSARLTVMLFCVAGLAGWYTWVRQIWGRQIALFSGLLILTNPVLIFFSRSVMLELPALTMIILSLLSLHHYLQRPTHLRSITTGMLIAAMLLTKQTTGFILPLMLLYPLLLGSIRPMIARQSVWAYLLVIIAILTLGIHASIFGTVALGGIEAGASKFPLSSPNRWLMHLRVIVEVYPWPLLALAVAGLGAMAFGPRKRSDLLAPAWVLLWYLAFSLVSTKYGNSLRYSTYLTPAVALLAARGLSFYGHKPALYNTWITILVAIIAWNIYTDSKSEQPFVSGLDRVAEDVLGRPDEGTILYCCKHDGNFIFHVRKNDVDQENIVLRADKILVSMVVHKFYGVVSHMQTENDLYRILDTYGVSIIVVESSDLVGLSEFGLLLNILRDGEKFQLLEEFPLETNVREFADIKIRIYRYLDQKPIPEKGIVFPMPHLGREVHLPRKTTLCDDKCN